MAGLILSVIILIIILRFVHEKTQEEKPRRPQKP